jgi:precorrin-6A/cobalt-precorrin-6A reductase
VTRVLLLGGSSEASAIARAVGTEPGYDVTVSYAGRTRERVTTPGRVRVGGFGGADGLAAYLRDDQTDLLVDATHPFAANMPHHAAAAARASGVPHLRVCRPAWGPQLGDRWHVVPDLDHAADALRAFAPARVFLTTGRQDLAPFARVDDAWFLVRAIEAPSEQPLPNALVVLARGPFAEDDERALLVEHRIDVIVSKNSGGQAAAAKLAAARSLGLPVVMVARPPAPDVPTVETVDEALAGMARQPREVQRSAG